MGPAAFGCGPYIEWAREQDQILLIDSQTGESWIVQGREAVVWDLLVLDYAHPKLVALLSAIWAVAVKEVEEILHETLIKWHRQGIVAVERNGDGEPNDQRLV
jgi:hypothetical protein